jgi:hypothetical protein
MAHKNDSVFDYADPYDIMVGTWNGITTSFGPDGRYLASVASLVYMSWVKRGSLLRYVQEEIANLDEVLDEHPHRSVMSQIVKHDFLLAVDGKACHSTGKHAEQVTLEGTETRPGTYIFHLTFPQGDYYNNQYFASPNERHIIGPFIPAGKSRKVGMVVAQTFTRVSYDVTNAKFSGNGKSAGKAGKKAAKR